MPPPLSRNLGPFSSPSGRFPASAEVVRQRVLTRLTEKLDPARLRRMPESFMRQEVRRVVEQLIDAENPRMGRVERDVLVEDLVGDALGFGPLEELFQDPTVREVLVMSPQAILVRRESGWLPTNVKFRDVVHLRLTLDKVIGRAEPVAGERLPSSAVDARMSNGFRVVAVIPPPVLEQSATVLFVRMDPKATGLATGGSSTAVPMLDLTRSTSAATQSPRSPSSMSGLVAAPAARPRPAEAPPANDALSRIRVRITERILSKLAGMGVYDLVGVDTRELQKIVGAYVSEYCESESLNLPEADYARLSGEVLAALKV